MSETTRTGSDGTGLLNTLLERVPQEWRDRLAEILDLHLAQTEWLGEESARVGSNLMALLGQGWPEIVAVGGRVGLLALGGALLVGISASMLGWLLYLIAAGPLLRRGWHTGRLIGCFAATLVVLLAGSGGAWAGFWLGASRAIEEAIEERYMVERVAAATFLAFTLEDGEAPRVVDSQAVEELLTRAQVRSAETWGAFRERADAAASDASLEQLEWLPADLMVAALQRLGGGAAPDLIALHQVLETPDAEEIDPLPQTADVRRRAVELLRASVYPQAAVSLSIGLGLPLGGLVLFGMLGLLIHRGTAPGQQGSG